MAQVPAAPLATEYLGELVMHIGASSMVGDGPAGRRRVDRLDRGHFAGPRIDAKLVHAVDILLGGTDGALRPDVRCVFEVHNGGFLLVQYRGVRHGPPAVMEAIAREERVDPAAYYLRTMITFETGSATYDWLNRVVAVGVGRREPGLVIYDVFAVQ